MRLHCVFVYFNAVLADRLGFIRVWAICVEDCWGLSTRPDQQELIRWVQLFSFITQDETFLCNNLDQPHRLLTRRRWRHNQQCFLWVYWLENLREKKTVSVCGNVVLFFFLNIWKITSKSNSTQFLIFNLKHNLFQRHQQQADFCSYKQDVFVVFFVFFFSLRSLGSCASEVRQRPNRFFGLLTAFNQCSITTATLSAIPKPEVKYVFCRASRLLLLTDDQKENSVPSYLHLTLLSN